MSRITNKTIFLALAGLLWLWSASPVSAQDRFHVALSDNKPPYTIADQPGGLEYDIVLAVAKEMGVKAEIEFLPNARAQMMLKNKELDAVIGKGGDYASEPFIAYENVGISLAKNKVEVRNISELVRYPVAAFQNAKKYLGDEFAAMAKTNRAYEEVSPQIILNRQLYGERTMVVISDLNIFYNLNTKLEPLFDSKQPLKIHRFFPPTLYSLIFNDPVLRDRFNKALAKYFATNPWPALAKKYLPLGVTETTFKVLQKTK